MIEHPLNRAYRRSGAISAPTLATSHLITIARLHAENDKLRRTLSDIDKLVVDFNHQRTTFAGLLVAMNAIRQVLREWRS